VLVAPCMMSGQCAPNQNPLSGSYDCVDRILLNAYFRMEIVEWFPAWWRVLTGSDEVQEDAHPKEIPRRSRRCIHGHTKTHKIAVIDC
jgi:hypothetical protein